MRGEVVILSERGKLVGLRSRSPAGSVVPKVRNK